MPRKKKSARDLTDDALAKRLFGTKGAAALKQAASEGKKSVQKSSSPKQSK